MLCSLLILKLCFFFFLNKIHSGLLHLLYFIFILIFSFFSLFFKWGCNWHWRLHWCLHVGVSRAPHSESVSLWYWDSHASHTLTSPISLVFKTPVFSLSTWHHDAHGYSLQKRGVNYRHCQTFVIHCTQVGDLCSSPALPLCAALTPPLLPEYSSHIGLLEFSTLSPSLIELCLCSVFLCCSLGTLSKQEVGVGGNWTTQGITLLISLMLGTPYPVWLMVPWCKAL